MTTIYKVQNRDVDGRAPARTYKTLDGAIKRFEEMYGHSVHVAIAEQFYAAEVLPTIRAVLHLRAVSDFGCVVTWTRIGEAEAEPAPTDDDHDPLDEMDDQEYMAEMRRRQDSHPGPSYDGPDYDIPF